MDPLSITTAIVALGGACMTVSKTLAKIRGVKQAPVIIQALNNEISDIRLALSDINDYLQNEGMTGAFIANADRRIFRMCTSMLKQTREKVQELEALLRSSILISKVGSTFRINRIAFLREETRLRQLQKDLRHARQQIANLMGHFGIRETSKIRVSLRELRLNNVQARTDLHDGFTILAEGQTRMEEMLAQVLQSQNVSSASSNSSQLAHSQARTQSTYGSIELSVARMRNTFFGLACACPRKRVSTDLRTCLGSVFLGYAAAPILGHHRQECPYRAEAELAVVYIFPIWFLSYVVSIYLRYRPFEGLSFSISCRQTISVNHAIWDYLRDGEIEKLKRLFSSNQISITAIDPLSIGLLYRAINTGHIDSIEFILKLGADPFLDRSGLKTPYRLAWNKILGNSGTVEWRNRLRSMLPALDYDLYGFGPLHKAVLGLDNHRLEDVAGSFNHVSEGVDCDGRTPLSWASSRGDTEAVEMLLALGADCNRADEQGCTPLIYASHVSKECVDQLLQAGADANAKTRNLATALHFAAYFAPSVQALGIAKSLIKAGCEVDLQSTIGQTALHSAIHMGNRELVQYLIRKGADMGIPDVAGYNALCFAVEVNFHFAVKFLLLKYQDHTGPIELVGTFMHHAAHRADAETLRLLAQGNLSRRDINVKNEAGLTSRTLSWQRANIDAEWREAFSDFLNSVDQDLKQTTGETQYPEGQGEDSESWDDLESSDSSGDEGNVLEEEAFEDAVEVQA